MQLRLTDLEGQVTQGFGELEDGVLVPSPAPPSDVQELQEEQRWHEDRQIRPASYSRRSSRASKEPRCSAANHLSTTDVSRIASLNGPPASNCRRRVLVRSVGVEMAIKAGEGASGPSAGAGPAGVTEGAFGEIRQVGAPAQPG